MHWKVVGGLLLLVVMAMAEGCASRIGHARLYSLDRAERIEMTLQFSGRHNGLAYATYPSGEELTGEFVVWSLRRGHIDTAAWSSIKTQIKSLEENEASGDSRRDEMAWPEVYGFGSDSKAVPAGTAMLIGNRGTSLEVILYHLDTEYSVTGDGLARDNRGNWYRVLIGDLGGGL